MSTKQISRDFFFDSVRSSFGRLAQTQVEGFSFLLGKFYVDELPQSHMAYMLATTWHETATTMQPIVERGSRAYIGALYDPILGSTAKRRKRAILMGNTKPGDGWRYRGQGFVQLTWKNNYVAMGQFLKIDLAGTPSLALVPENAYNIMKVGMQRGFFTGSKLSDYLTTTVHDYVGARKIINGTDRAKEIAEIARHFNMAFL